MTLPIDLRRNLLGRWPTATTAIAGVIGHPIRHSLSPALHNAALASLGIDRVYVAFDVDRRGFDAAFQGASALGLRGLSVTMPHKEAAAQLASRRTSVARRLGSANTITFEERGPVADSTDGDGLLDDLRAGAAFDPEGRRCGVIGAGGAARAVVLALASAGAEEVVVVNRTVASAWRAAALAPGTARVGRPEELAQCDLVVQATPVGMGTATGASSGPENGGVPGREDELGAVIAGVDPARFAPGQLVVDLVYDPALTTFLEVARHHGASTRNGLGILVHQAARQFTLWTGEVAPVALMWEAANLRASTAFAGPPPVQGDQVEPDAGGAVATTGRRPSYSKDEGSTEEPVASGAGGQERPSGSGAWSSPS